jgi:7-cyano-7-deazaguanine synthase in queuosine biosynthesis
MNNLYFRSAITDTPKSGEFSAVLGPLNWQRGGGIKHTIQNLFVKPHKPSLPVWSFLQIGLSVFAADKLFRRNSSEDCWTRDIDISIPVHTNPKKLKELTDSCLTFLTGDRWNVTLRPASLAPTTRSYYKDKFRPDYICLFSGGADSLTNAINMLEDGRKLLLIGHHDFSHTAGVQNKLYRLLLKQYGGDRVRLHSVEVKVLNALEDSTRSRSLLFIALGLTAASAFGKDIPLVVPENGYIGINAPLTPGRFGSCSTRTTHPRYFDFLQDMLSSLDIEHKIINPLIDKTKGSVLETCRNIKLLETLYPKSISCAHPTAGRWKGHSPGNCGYCFPCLIRRASSHRLGWDKASDYSEDAVGDPKIFTENGDRSVDLRSLLLFVNRFKNVKFNSATEILKAGSLGSRSFDLQAFANVHREGSQEIINLLNDKACKEVSDFAGI